MKLSVSLPAEDVEFLDSLVAQEGLPSRSAAVHQAVRTLQSLRLGPAYEVAWTEWHQAGEGDVWEATVADGLDE